MTTSQEAMRKALEDLCAELRGSGHVRAVQLATKAHELAVQQAAQEPQPEVGGPEADGTDFAHPAWWRGYEHGCETLCRKITEILDGKDDGRGVASEPWESTRCRLLALYAAAPAKPQIGRAALTEFIDKFCLRNPQLMACAESAFYAFNLSLAGAKPAEQEKGGSNA